MEAGLPECGICLDKYKTNPPSLQPTQLSCGHTFHRQCLETMSNHSNNRAVITCPFCNQPTNGPVESLKCNYALLEVLGSIERSSPAVFTSAMEQRPPTTQQQTIQQQMVQQKTTVFSPPSFNISTEAIKSGKMFKIGGPLMRGWQERYFRLENKQLKWWATEEEYKTNKKEHHCLDVTAMRVIPALPSDEFEVEGPNEKDKTKTKTHRYKVLPEVNKNVWINGFVLEGARVPTFEFYKPGMDEAAANFKVRFPNYSNDYLFTEVRASFLALPPVNDNSRQAQRSAVGIPCKIYVTNFRVVILGQYKLRYMTTDILLDCHFNEVSQILKYHKRPNANNSKLDPPQNLVAPGEPFGINAKTDLKDSIHSPNVVTFIAKQNQAFTVYGFEDVKEYDILCRMIHYGRQYSQSWCPWFVSHNAPEMNSQVSPLQSLGQPVPIYAVPPSQMTTITNQYQPAMYHGTNNPTTIYTSGLQTTINRITQPAPPTMAIYHSPSIASPPPQPLPQTGVTYFPPIHQPQPSSIVNTSTGSTMTNNSTNSGRLEELSNRSVASNNTVNNTTIGSNSSFSTPSQASSAYPMLYAASAPSFEPSYNSNSSNRTAPSSTGFSSSPSTSDQNNSLDNSSDSNGYSGSSLYPSLANLTNPSYSTTTTTTSNTNTTNQPYFTLAPFSYSPSVQPQ